MADAAVQRREVPASVLLRFLGKFTAPSRTLHRVECASTDGIPITFSGSAYKHSYDATLRIRDGNWGAANRSQRYLW